jgi:hypothetical protein
VFGRPLHVMNSCEITICYNSLSAASTSSCSSKTRIWTLNVLISNLCRFLKLLSKWDLASYQLPCTVGKGLTTTKANMPHAKHKQGKITDAQSVLLDLRKSLDHFSWSSARKCTAYQNVLKEYKYTRHRPPHDSCKTESYRIYRSDTSASSRFEPSTFSKLKQCSIGTLPGGGPGQQSQPPAPTVVTYYYVAPPRYHTGVVPHNNTVAWKCLCAASIKIKYHENCWLTGWPCSIVEPCGTSCSIG